MSNITVHLMQYGHTACLIDGPPKDWPKNHKWDSDVKNVNCPMCLEGLEFGEATFEILEDGKAFKCRRCGNISRDQSDVTNHWCDRCHASHDDIWPPARRAWMNEYAIPS